MKPLKALRKKAVFSAITDDGTFATVLHIIALHTYGPEIYDLELLEIRQRLSEDFHADLSEQNESKLNAVLLATSTDAFYNDPEAFQAICNTLVDGDPGLDVLSDLTIPEIMWGMYEVNLNHGEDQFGPRVEAVINQVIEGESNEPENEEEDPMAYIDSAMEEAREKLRHQLEEIGIDTPDLPPVRADSKPPLLATE